MLSLSSIADGQWPPLRQTTHPVGVDDLIDPSRSAIPGTSGLWIGRRFWSLTSPVKGRCPSAHAGAEGLAAGRDALTIERGHPTLPLHRPCGRSPSPWQGRFCPGPSFRPAPHPPAMHPRRGGHWPSAAGTIKQNTPMQIRTRLGFTNLHRRAAFRGMIPRMSDAAQSGGLCCILSPSCGGSAAGNGIHSRPPCKVTWSVGVTGRLLLQCGRSCVRWSDRRYAFRRWGRRG